MSYITSHKHINHSYLRAYKAHLYICRENSTNPPLFEKTNPIFPIFRPKTPIYKKTKPIQTQFNPKQTQYDERAKMNAFAPIKESYDCLNNTTRDFYHPKGCHPKGCLLPKIRLTEFLFHLTYNSRLLNLIKSRQSTKNVQNCPYQYKKPAFMTVTKREEILSCRLTVALF
jgi:hypothetical protein